MSSSKIKVIKNFLPKKVFRDIHLLMLSDAFPWYYQSTVTYKELKRNNFFYFTHVFFKDEAIRSPWFHYWQPALDKLNVKNLKRIKANIYPQKAKVHFHDPHVDFQEPHQTCLVYMNKNNGPTRIKDKLYYPEANKAVIFNGEYTHQSSCCTDAHIRITVNINYN